MSDIKKIKVLNSSGNYDEYDIVTDKIGTSSVGDNTHPVYLNNGVPTALDNSVVYSAGTGLSKSGATLNHSNSITAGSVGTSSATSGSTLAVPYVTYDAQGHITGTGTHTHTVSGFLTSGSNVSLGQVTSNRGNTCGFVVNNTAGGEASIAYQASGTNKWIVGIGCGGVGVDNYAFYNTTYGDTLVLYADKHLKSMGSISTHGSEHYLRWIRGTTVVQASGTSYGLWSASTLNSYFGVSNCGTGNLGASFTNGDSSAQSVHVDGCTLVSGAVYAVFGGQCNTGSFRINFVVWYFG